MTMWRTIAGEIALGARIAATTWTPALLALLAVSIVYAVSGAYARGPWGGLGENAALLGTVFVWAALFRAYAPLAGRAVAEPPQNGVSLLVGALWACWPVLLYFVVETWVLRTFTGGMLLPRAAARTVAWIFLAPGFVLTVFAAWAYADVAVSGASANAAVRRVFGAAFSRGVLVRAVVVTALGALTGWPLWHAIEMLIALARAPYGPVVHGIALAASYAIVQALLTAIVLTTAPPAQEPAIAKTVKAPAAGREARPSAQPGRKRRRRR